MTVVTRSLPEGIRPKAYVSSCLAAAEAEAFLAVNGLRSKGRFCQCSSANNLVELLGNSALVGAGDLILVISDAVRRSGELRPDVLAQVEAAHRHCTAAGKELSVLPNSLSLSLALVESMPLSRSSRVQQGSTDDWHVDVRSLNALSPTTFEAFSEARLDAKPLTCAHQIIRLQLSSPSFPSQMKDLAAGKKFRLGPVLVDGTIHGVLCNWSCPHPESCPNQHLPDKGDELLEVGHLVAE